MMHGVMQLLRFRTYKWCENQRIRRVRHSISKSAILSKRVRTAPATTAGKAPGRAYWVTTILESIKHEMKFEICVLKQQNSLVTKKSAMSCALDCTLQRSIITNV